MGRGLGSNARVAGAYEASYGVTPATGFLTLPIVSTTLGEERGLIESNIIGLGRQPQDPTYDVATNNGDVVVPVDVRALGWWLRLLMGAPVSTASGFASARWTFSALPAVNSTITVNGTVFTFVASGATGNQINIGASVDATIDNMVTVLNASAVSGVAIATYSKVGTTVLLATLDAAGPAGNGFTVAASTSPASNAVATGQTQLLGTFTFSAQPSTSSTITIGGTAFTFVASGATGNQINIGGSLPVTLANAAAVLNASSVAAVRGAVWSVLDNRLIGTLRPGTSAAATTLAAGTSPASNATVSGATAASFTTAIGGTMSHVFASGALSLPSMSLEMWNPDVPSASVHYGLRANQMRIGLQRSGLLDATIGCIAKGESVPTTSTSIVPVSPGVTTRFAQATGSITRNGVALGSVEQAEFNFSNTLDPVETIQTDGRIEDADPGMVMASGSLTVRFADNVLQTDATNQTPVALTFGWTNASNSLTISLPRVFLPRVKRPVSGPRGISAQINWQASGALAEACTVTLVNDVASYAAA